MSSASDSAFWIYSEMVGSLSGSGALYGLRVKSPISTIAISQSIKLQVKATRTKPGDLILTSPGMKKTILASASASASVADALQDIRDIIIDESALIQRPNEREETTFTNHREQVLDELVIDPTERHGVVNIVDDVELREVSDKQLTNRDFRLTHNREASDVRAVSGYGDFREQIAVIGAHEFQPGQIRRVHERNVRHILNFIH